ncbi:Asp23/Gls24 family envelope stress response protein [Streptomyces sp. NPDC020607]|uniref:Asp23/Gls24 family envelope stress response protein n=1 Tax=Streptomyces sp. NPDC020607 TaxID=3365082 RepID=UPI0037BCF079
MTDEPTTDAPTTGGPTANGPDELLPCGRALWDVWERAESGGSDPHAESCPHCTEALHTLWRLEDVVSAAREDDPREYESDASALVGRVMDVVRLELRPGRTLPLGEAAEDLWIVEAAAARTVRAAAESLPGVRAGSCRIEALSQEAGAAPEGRWPRGPVHIRAEVAVALTRNLQEVAERVRRAILEAVDAELGMRVAAVDVTVADILDEAADDGDTTEGRLP